MEKITFVTAFYKLRQRENNYDPYCVATDRYLKAAERIYNKDINLVVFIEPDDELRNHLKKHREGKEHKTLIIERPYEELRLWPKFNRFVEMDRNYHIPNCDNRKFTPLYYLIINSKVDFVNDAIDINPFNTPRFSWIDFRSFELSPITDESFNQIGDLVSNDRIHINMMCYTTKGEVANRYDFYRFMRGKIAATFWIGGKNELKTFINRCNEELEWCFNNGFALTEEMIYGYVLGTNPELFHPFIGDYCESLINFDGIHRNEWLAFRSLNMALEDKNYEYVKMICEIILKSFYNNYMNLDNNKLFEICICILNSNVYLNKREDSIKLLEKLYDNVIKNNELRNIVVQNKSFILLNIHDQSNELYGKFEQL